jgi:hypothetical protein
VRLAGELNLQLKKGSVLALVALVVVGLSLAWLTSGLLQAQASALVPSDGNVDGGDVDGQISSSVNIGVFSDADATVSCSSVNWGSLSPGSVASQVIYVKNTGDTTTTLSLSATDWVPSSASSALTLSWDKEGNRLTPGTVVRATIRLIVASDTGDLSTFSFNIVVSGTA